jgi:hypothetical protein
MKVRRSNHKDSYLIIFSMIVLTAAMSISGQMEAQERSESTQQAHMEALQKADADMRDRDAMAALELLNIDKPSLLVKTREAIANNEARVLAELEGAK